MSLFTETPRPNMRTTFILAFTLLAFASTLHAKRYSSEQKKLNAIQAQKDAVSKWKKLYSMKPSKEDEKPKETPVATVTDATNNAVQQQQKTKEKPLKPSPSKQQQKGEQQKQEQKYEEPKPAPTISKDPKEEKQKQERYKKPVALKSLTFYNYLGSYNLLRASTRDVVNIC
jgi:hypothetical protein